MDPAMWHFGFGGQDMERLVAGRERIYLDRFWNELSRDGKRLMKRSASIMRRSMRNRAQCERALPSSWRSARMRPTTGVPCTGQASDASLGLGWRSYIRPYDRHGDRCVADNVEDVIIPIAGTGSRKNSGRDDKTCRRVPAAPFVS